MTKSSLKCKQQHEEKKPATILNPPPEACQSSTNPTPGRSVGRDSDPLGCAGIGQDSNTDVRELGESIKCGEADASSLREFLQRKSLDAKNRHVSSRTVCAQRENAVIGCSRFAPPLIFTPPLSNVNKKVVKPANRSAIDTGSPLAQEWDQFLYAKHLASRQMPHRQCGVCARVYVYVRAGIVLTEM